MKKVGKEKYFLLNTGFMETLFHFHKKYIPKLVIFSSIQIQKGKEFFIKFIRVNVFAPKAKCLKTDMKIILKLKNKSGIIVILFLKGKINNKEVLIHSGSLRKTLRKNKEEDKKLKKNKN